MKYPQNYTRQTIKCLVNKTWRKATSGLIVLWNRAWIVHNCFPIGIYCWSVNGYKEFNIYFLITRNRTLEICFWQEKPGHEYSYN